MLEHFHNKEENQELKELITRYESGLGNGAASFFDLDEFEDIIDYYLDFGLTQKARTALHHAFRIYPGSSLLNLKRAQILAFQNKREKALDLLSELEASEPENTDIKLTKAHIYSQMQQYDKSIEEYMKASEDSEQDLEDIFINIAFEYENKGDYQGASEYLKRALDINSDNESVIYELSYCFEMLDSPEEAIPYFNSYIDRHPFSTLAWFNLGVTYSQMERWNEAIDAYDYVLAIDEHFASAYFNKANALGGLGLYEKAIEAYLETFRHEEPDSLTWYYIGECYEKMERFRDAIDHYLKSVSLNDKHADAWMGVGSCYQQMGNTGLAAQYLNIAINKDPKNPEPWYMLGDVLREKADFTKADQCYRMVMSLDPEREDIWLDIHDLCLETGQNDEAISIIDQGITHFPLNPLFQYRKVVSLFFSGLVKESLRLLDELVALYPAEAASIYEIAPELRDHEHFGKTISD